MKKLIFITVIGLISLNLFGQTDSIDITDVDIKNTTSLSPVSYFPYFEMSTDTTMYRISAEYLMPWVKSGTNIWPRSTSYNLVLGYAGAAAGKLWVQGTSYFTDDMTLSGGKKLVWGGGSYIYETSNVLYLYDPTTGTKSLAQLASESGGSGEGDVRVNGAPDSLSLVYWYNADSTIAEIPGWSIDGSTIKGTITANGDTALFITGGAANGTGLFVDANAGFSGILVTASDALTGGGVYVWGDQDDASVNYTSYSENATSTHFIAKSSSDTAFMIKGDSVFWPMYADANNPTWLVVTINGAVDTGTLTAAKFMLEMKEVLSAIERIEEMQGGEIRWYYTKGGEVKSTFNLSELDPMQQLQAMVAAIEMGVINTADLEKRIIELERTENYVDHVNTKVNILYAIFILIIIMLIYKRR